MANSFIYNYLVAREGVIFFILHLMCQQLSIPAYLADSRKTLHTHRHRHTRARTHRHTDTHRHTHTLSHTHILISYTSIPPADHVQHRLHQQLTQGHNEYQPAKQTDRQPDRETDRQPNRQRERQPASHTDRQTDREIALIPHLST